MKTGSLHPNLSLDLWVWSTAASLLLGQPLAGESLWQNAGPRAQSLVSDQRAAQTGDILTVVVSESVVTKNTQSTSTGRETSMDASISSFFYPATASSLGQVGGALPATAFDGKNSFSSTGALSQNQSAVARAAVLVTDVLPNGNLVIKGVRKITISGQSQFVVLSGLVRPRDIEANNTVSSAHLAEATVEFIDEGKLTDGQKKGWLTKIFDFLRPY